MKKYCTIITVKPEHMQDYVDLHKNAWPEILEAIESAGAENLVIFRWENRSIVFFECDDLDEFYVSYGKTDACRRWNAVTTPWFDDSPTLDGSGSVDNLEKIFDYKEQLAAIRNSAE